MNPSVERAPLVLPAADRVRVVFSWIGDRWNHVVAVRSAGGAPASESAESARHDAWADVLCSVEGAPDESWPASPALQDGSVELRPTGAVALLVGMAGGSHFSLSVTATASFLLFEAACRVRAATPELRCTYRATGRAHPSALIESEANADVSVHGDLWTVRCIAGTDRRPATLSWSYRLAWPLLLEQRANR